MTLSTATTNLVQHVTSPGGEAPPEEPLVVEFRAEEVEALEATRLKFTPEGLAEIEERQRRMQAAFERMAAAATLEEQQRIGDQLWAQQVEGPRAARRIQAARRPRVLTVIAPLARAREQRPAGTQRTSSSSRTSSTDPGDDPDPDDGPWALSLVDRAPFLWRLRALRCRLLEIREGVDR